MPNDDVPTKLYNSITVHNKAECNDDEELLNGPYEDETVAFTHSGIVDMEGIEISENDKKCAAMKKGQPIIAVPHGAVPVNEFNNAELWLGAFPHLHPYGTGGPRSLDGKFVNLKTYLQHLLNFCYYDYRKELTFVMSMYNVIHKQEVCMQTSLTVKRPLFSNIYSDYIDSV